MNQKTLWIATAVVVVVMLGGAIFIARSPAEAPVAIAQAPVPVVETVPLAPVADVVSETPQPAPAEATPQAPIVYDEVAVDLTKIAGKLKMSSPDIPAAAAGELPRYPLALTCYRKNASPALRWNNAPTATKSFVLVLERRARDEKASWSWIMFNIPASAADMPGKVAVETLTPAQGIFGTNPFGHQAYTGPCEPKGVFPYVLRLFALDIELPLQAGAPLADILPAMNGHVIDAAEIKADHYLRM